MMNKIFDLCVLFLVWLAEATGTTYKEINVIVFCFLGPIIFIVLVWIIVIQKIKLKQLEKFRQEWFK